MLNLVEGQSFHNVVYLGEATRTHPKIRKCKFRCYCGTVFECQPRALKSGNTSSCGCFRKDNLTTHGLSKDERYQSWVSMLWRVKNNPDYHNVKIDERWKTINGFIENQPNGRSYFKGAQLARYNDDGDYTPENCRWATREENARESCEKQSSKRHMRKLNDGRFGLDVARENNIPQQTYHARLKYGWSVEDACTYPAQKRPRKKP